MPWRWRQRPMGLPAPSSRGSGHGAVTPARDTRRSVKSEHNVSPAVIVSSLSKHFGRCKALDAVSLAIEPGELVALIGASGSGKSTLLRHIAGLTAADPTSASSIEVHGRAVQHRGRIAPNVRDIRAGIGFVFQQFNLVGRLPVLTNVLAGLLNRVPTWRSILKHFDRDEIRAGLEALARVSMAEHALQRASTLSGGQQQRVAIARTLTQRASIILADEPIASLDPKSARRVMDILATINNEDKTTVVVSLHQVDMALYYCPRTIALSHGQIVYDGESRALTPPLLRRLYGAEADEMLDVDSNSAGNPTYCPAFVGSSGKPADILDDLTPLSQAS
jgi:phosphonate transport system ATP-binding protein